MYIECSDIGQLSRICVGCSCTFAIWNFGTDSAILFHPIIRLNTISSCSFIGIAVLSGSCDLRWGSDRRQIQMALVVGPLVLRKISLSLFRLEPIYKTKQLYSSREIYNKRWDN